jgi:F-type H+-transporting ATPase subunit b
MDQIITIFHVDWKILLVQIINFSLLMGVLWYVLYKPVTGLIESRRAQIIKGVADAERAEVALRDADAKKGEIITGAMLEAERLVTAAREQAEGKKVASIE